MERQSQAGAWRSRLSEARALDGSVLNAGLGGALMRRTSSRNRLEIAGLSWEPELVLHLESPGQDKGFSSGCWLGMDVLGRFDTILDFQHDQVYLRPNAHFHDPFPVRAGPSTAIVMLGVGVLSIASILGATWYRSRRKAA